MFLLLSESEVRRVLPIESLIEAMESAVARYSAGEVVQPLRSVVQVGGDPAFFGLMPAYMPEPRALGAKLVTVFNSNAARNLPTHLASIVLLDPATGALAAMMDGRYITEARTAAVSAVSAKYLAPQRAGQVLGIFGSGVQARSHLEALSRVRRLTDVRVWSPNEERRRQFATDMAAHLDAPVHAVSSAEHAASGASLIVLATSAVQPVLFNDWVGNGTHVMAVGACRPDQREMDPALVARGRLFVDSRAGALAEAGDIVMPIAEGRFTARHIAGELGEVVSRHVPGRVTIEDVTIFKSLGMAIEDVVAAELAYRRALEQGVGRRLEI